MYRRFGKRVLDIVVAFGGLIMLAVPMGIVGICVKLSSRGPALFKQERVGQGGKIFGVRKFRTMTLDHEDSATVTVRGDRRITSFGRFLRRFKLDEFPQLWNVLIGEMSFVGPRPDVPGYYDRLQGEDRRVLSLKPGITGPSSVKYSDEEALLALQPDPVRFNDLVIFPDKVRFNLEYLDLCSFWTDIFWLRKTLELSIKRTRKGQMIAA